MGIDDKAIEAAAKKLRKLRLTYVGGRRDHLCETVKSVLQKGLGGLYDDAVVEYILKFGVKYYNEVLKSISDQAATRDRPCRR